MYKNPIPFLHEVTLNIKMRIVSVMRSEQQLLSILLQRNGITAFREQGTGKMEQETSGSFSFFYLLFDYPQPMGGLL